MAQEREELHLKFRPKNFDEYIGNEPLKESLLNGGIERSRTFLFHGKRGCGKTTLSRLIAKHLNISDMDLHEIDAADNTGVDNARQIKEAAQFSPLSGKFKMYIIDECHRLTGNAFDSLLKTLENPPKHCYFALATTELQKVPATIKSRSKSYEVSPLNEKEMNFLIKWICHDEGIKLSPNVKRAIIDTCEGVPREIIIAIDTVRDVKNDVDAISLINSALSSHETKELIQALLQKRKWSDVAPIIKALKDDPEKVRYSILGYVGAILLNGKADDHLAMIIEQFLESFMYTGKAGLTYACYMILK